MPAKTVLAALFLLSLGAMILVCLEALPQRVSADAAATDEVRKAAEETAARGASMAQAAGFRAQSFAIKEAPTWKGIARVADDRDASLIVLGSHGKSGLTGVFLGSVASAVTAHSGRTVLIVHGRV